MTQESLSFVDFIVILGAIFGLFYIWTSAILKESKTRSNLVQKLRSYDAVPFYRDRLTSILDKLDFTLSKPKFTLNFIIKNILFHYGLSILYIFIVFLTIWLWGGSHTIGAIEILPQLSSVSERLYFLLKLTILIGLLVLILSNKFDIFLSQYIKSDFIHFLIVGVGVGVLGVVGVVAGVLGVVAGVVGVVGVIVAGVGVVVVGVGVVGVISGIFSLLEGGNFLTANNSSFFIFFLLIPFINACLDFLSLTISRIFFRYISKGEAWYKILLHLLLDFLLALLFLVGLALLLYYAINYYNTLVTPDLHIPIAQMMQSTLKSPLSLDNAWITFMLLSTLIPTVLHFSFALINFLLYITKLAPWYAHRIEKNKKYASQRMFTSFLMSAPMTLISFFVLYFVYLMSIKIINFVF